MSDYVTHDSGERREFSTGARRDVSTGKPRYDLIPPTALRRWADLMARGAAKYGDRNWERGMEVSIFIESLLRHVYAYIEGDTDEDHLAAILFNAGGIIHMEEQARKGKLPGSLLDAGASKDVPVPNVTQSVNVSHTGKVVQRVNDLIAGTPLLRRRYYKATFSGLQPDRLVVWPHNAGESVPLFVSEVAKMSDNEIIAALTSSEVAV